MKKKRYNDYNEYDSYYRSYKRLKDITYDDCYEYNEKSGYVEFNSYDYEDYFYRTHKPINGWKIC